LTKIFSGVPTTQKQRLSIDVSVAAVSFSDQFLKRFVFKPIYLWINNKYIKLSLKNTLVLLSLILVTSSLWAQGTYYNGVDLDLDGIPLRNELAGHIISTHGNFLSYGEVWDVLKQSDLNPGSSNNVLLCYGYNDSDSDIINDRTRDKNENGGNVGDWNREHVYPKSLGNPNLGTAGPGSDPHHLRSTDVQMNGNRGSLKFSTGNGTAGSSSGGWYPGNEWKGDCARMIMYMYLRYGNQCLPDNVGIGSTNTIDNNMVNLFLDWNAADPVSEYELVRNEVVEDAQGNRNPFIDNPALATKIWGGVVADDPWGILVGIEEVSPEKALLIFPNPCIDYLSIQLNEQVKIEKLQIFDQFGRLIKVDDFQFLIDVSELAGGYYHLSYDVDGIRQSSPFIILPND
jgi:endonuclease I